MRLHGHGPRAGKQLPALRKDRLREIRLGPLPILRQPSAPPPFHLHQHNRFLAVPLSAPPPLPPPLPLPAPKHSPAAPGHPAAKRPRQRAKAVHLRLANRLLLANGQQMGQRARPSLRGHPPG